MSRIEMIFLSTNKIMYDLNNVSQIQYLCLGASVIGVR